MHNVAYIMPHSGNFFVRKFLELTFLSKSVEDSHHGKLG